MCVSVQDKMNLTLDFCFRKADSSCAHRKITRKWHSSVCFLPIVSYCIDKHMHRSFRSTEGYDSYWPRRSVWLQYPQQVGRAKLSSMNLPTAQVQQTATRLLFCMQHCNVSWLTLQAQVHLLTLRLLRHRDKDMRADLCCWGQITITVCRCPK